MFRWLSWGGIRGRGLSIKSDVVMSVVALIMATLLLILVYFLYERNAVKAFCETRIDPTITQTDLVVQRVDKVWDSELVTKTPDPLNPEIDPVSLRSIAISLNDQLLKDTNELHKTRVAFADLPAAPNPCEMCVEKTGAYIRTADNYGTVMQDTIKYLHDLALIEANMNEASQEVQLGGGNVAPDVLLKRDGTMAAELEKIKALIPPPMMKQFHEDTVSFLTDYTTISQQMTAGYIAGSDLYHLEALGREGETVLHNGRDKLKDDLTAVKSLILGGQAKLLRGYRQSAREQVYDLKNKYRF
jgi:hypothetical protein